MRYLPRRRGSRGADRRRGRRCRRSVPLNQSITLATASLSLGVARGRCFNYLAIEGGVQGEPVFGSLAVNARAGQQSLPAPAAVRQALRAAP